MTLPSGLASAAASALTNLLLIETERLLNIVAVNVAFDWQWLLCFLTSNLLLIASG